MTKPMTDAEYEKLKYDWEVYAELTDSEMDAMFAEIDLLRADYSRMLEEWTKRETDNLDLAHENFKLTERVKELDRLLSENRRLAGDCRRLQAVIDRLHQGA